VGGGKDGDDDCDGEGAEAERRAREGKGVRWGMDGDENDRSRLPGGKVCP
jgi:hypothetical protein